MSAAPTQLPWSRDRNADASTTMNLLSGMLEVECGVGRNGIMKKMADGVRAATILSCIGVIAGYSAQCAAADAVLRKLKPRAPNDLVKVACKDGSVLYDGSEINRHLVPGPVSTYALASFLGGAVVHSGYTSSEVIDADEVVDAVVAASGTAEFDSVRAPDDCRPYWNVSQSLRHIWPKARRVLEHRLQPPTVARPVDVQHWPVVASVVAQQYITMAKDIIPAPVAMSIILESAVKASRRRLVGADASPLFQNDSLIFDQKMQ